MIRKEVVEWIHCWADETDKNDLPRVLLIGDSITNGYQEHVREKLRGVCYVDYISSSFSVEEKRYQLLIDTFFKFSDYDLIHYNFGLHGEHLSKNTYKKWVKKTAERLAEKSKVALVKSTVIFKEGNKKLDNKWMKKVNERNQALEEIAEENKYVIDDLFTASTMVATEKRYPDGTHYLTEGYQELASTVAEFIKKNLKK